MNIRLQVILIISSIIFFLFVLLVTNKKKMNFNYTMLWMIFSLTILILALFPNITVVFSEIIGIEVPVNALFLFFIFIEMVINLFLAIETSKLNNKIITLTQEIAILKEKTGEKNEEKK